MVERCILVGMEDLSSVRRARKMIGRRRRSESRNGIVVDDIDVDRESDVDIGFKWTLEESMVEMRELIKTAGLVLEGEIVQRLQEVNPKTYIGTGKVREAQALLASINENLERRDGGVTSSGCCTVVFDAELTPGQQKALENAFNRKVIENDFLAGADDDTVIKVMDRTALILDIFAQHARTREGKLQVDLALHKYRKPRLTRMWTHLADEGYAGHPNK
jgi:GTP-binding protein HflX